VAAAVAHKSDDQISSSDVILSKMRRDVFAIFQDGLRAVEPSEAIHRYCKREKDLLILGNRTYDLNDYNNILVVGAGKATAAMAMAMEDLLKYDLSEGLICVKYGHTAPLKKIRIVEAGHPIPDTNGQSASAQILKMVQKLGDKDLVIVLLSGGGSALLPLPVQGISLKEKQDASNTLINCGATIHEINALRKHISRIKGGRLAQAAYPAKVATLILSDVVGDNLDVIASGPTVPDVSTFSQCREVIERYGIAEQLPAAIVAHLKMGQNKAVPETPKTAHLDWNHVYNLIVGSNMDAIAAAGKKAQTLGYNTLILSSRIEGETRTVAQVHGAIAREILANSHPLSAPACLLSGGETTVTLKGNGLGGRNQEFALAAAIDIEGAEHIVVLSGGTDGTDGPTDAAGAIVDGTTVERGKEAGMEIRHHLKNNDAYPFFKRLNDLLMTGPTQTNVMDLHIALVQPPC
jgi:hydroxypyruvate reductase